MSTHAHLHITNKNDSIYLLTNADGTDDFVHQKITKTDSEINSTIAHLQQHLSQHLENSINREMLSRWLQSLQSFQEKPLSLTKIATLTMWGRIHNFFPMTHMALCLQKNKNYKIPPMDYCVFQDNEHIKFEFNSMDLKNIQSYAEVPISSDYSLLQIIDSEDYHHISNGKTYAFNTVTHETGRFIKFKSNDIQKLTNIITTLPLQISSLFDVWTFSLNWIEKYHRGDNTQEAIMGAFKRSIERLSNFNFSTRKDIPKIDDKEKLDEIFNISPLQTSGYNFINYLLIFYPDLFEEVTIGESTYILNNEPKVAVRVMVNSDYQEINMCVNGETPQSQEIMFQKLNNAYKEIFMNICNDWGINPESSNLTKFSNTIRRVSDIKFSPVTEESNFLYINPKYQSISFNILEAIYSIVRMYDKSLLNKKTQNKNDK